MLKPSLQDGRCLQADQLFGRLLGRSPGLVYEPALMEALLDAVPAEDGTLTSSPGTTSALRSIQRVHQVLILGGALRSRCMSALLLPVG